MAFWTPEEEKILRKLVEAGKRTSDIMTVFPARTQHSIVQKITAMRLVRPRVSNIDYAAFEKTMKAGKQKCL